MVELQGTAKLLNFGSARAWSFAQAAGALCVPSSARAWRVYGTIYVGSRAPVIALLGG
jgi:hypothetical protein